jgi:hypothetical protein
MRQWPSTSATCETRLWVPLTLLLLTDISLLCSKKFVSAENELLSVLAICSASRRTAEAKRKELKVPAKEQKGFILALSFTFQEGIDGSYFSLSVVCCLYF